MPLAALLILVAQFERGDKAARSILDLYLRNTRFINNWDLVDALQGDRRRIVRRDRGGC